MSASLVLTMRVDNLTFRRARLLSSEFVRAGHAASNVHGLGTLVQRLLGGPVRKRTCRFRKCALAGIKLELGVGIHCFNSHSVHLEACLRFVLGYSSMNQLRNNK